MVSSGSRGWFDAGWSLTEWTKSGMACFYCFTKARRSSSWKKKSTRGNGRRSASASGGDCLNGDGENGSAGRPGWGKRGKKSEGGVECSHARTGEEEEDVELTRARGNGGSSRGGSR